MKDPKSGIPILTDWSYKLAVLWYQQDMCLWNTDATGSNKVKIWQKSLSPIFRPRPPPGAFDVSEVWGIHRWTYSPNLVTVSSPKLSILLFVCKRDGITHRQTDGRTNDPITICPRPTFQVGGIKTRCIYKILCPCSQESLK